MAPATSLYLEMLRFLAALAVFLLHITYQGMTGGFLWQLGKFGKDAVMLFFVLSGYVIAFSAEFKHKLFTDYMVARLSRLWSVALPAIALTFLLDNTAALINPNSVLPDRMGFTFESTFASAFFINEIWFIDLAPGTNSPFWSIGYEFLYYVLFATAFYFKGITKILLVALAVALAGPKIMLLFPIWLLGVLAYRISKIEFGPVMGWALWAVSLIGLLSYYVFDFKAILESIIPAGQILSNGKHSHSDLAIKYAFALLIFANIVGFNIIGSKFLNFLEKYKDLIKGAARYSFSLYLYHFPFLMFFKVICSNSIGQWWQIAIMYIGTLGGVYLLAIYTEPTKDDIAKLLNKVIDICSWRKNQELQPNQNRQDAI